MGTERTPAVPLDSAHAVTASRLCAWLIMAGWPAEQLLQTSPADHLG
ncbi:hypothetical protein [Micromonospora sp. Llam0]|nr:hypothetical protein [Micromonospora sp. Llam0]